MEKLSKILVKGINNISKNTKLFLAVLFGILSISGYIYFFTDSVLSLSENVEIKTMNIIILGLSVLLMFLFVSFLISYFRNLKVVGGYVYNWIFLSTLFSAFILFLFLLVPVHLFSDLIKVIPLFGIGLFAIAALLTEFPKAREFTEEDMAHLETLETSFAGKIISRLSPYQYEEFKERISAIRKKYEEEKKELNDAVRDKIKGMNLEE